MVRIAVVEDEAVSRQLLADYLARYSEENNVPFEVTYFEDGGAIIGDYRPVYDIILMDIQMTHVDGMTAARAIREVDQEVVLVDQPGVCVLRAALDVRRRTHSRG